MNNDELDELSTVEEYKERIKKANRSHMLVYSEFYLGISRGDYAIRQQYVLSNSYKLWYNTVGATYWSIR